MDFSAIFMRLKAISSSPFFPSFFLCLREGEEGGGGEGGVGEEGEEGVEEEEGGMGRCCLRKVIYR